MAKMAAIPQKWDPIQCLSYRPVARPTAMTYLGLGTRLFGKVGTLLTTKIVPDRGGTLMAAKYVPPGVT